MTYLITLNYNNSQDTIEFLASLEQVKTDYKLIIVDNNSIKEDFENLKKYLNNLNQTKFIENEANNFRFDSQDRILLIREEKNLGFAGGNNRGIQIALKQTDFEGVALINNDTIVDPDFLEEILNFRKQNEKADLIGCRILFENSKDVLWYDGGKYYKHFTRATHIHENKNISQISNSKAPCKTEFITGCFMYISKRCIDKIGLLNDSLFMYNEDLEYCIRATKNDLLLYYVPTAKIWHKIDERSGGNRSCFSAYWGARNRFKVSQMHSNSIDQSLTFIFYVLTRIPRFLIWLFQGRIDLIKAQTKGMIEGLKK
jgi:GT2 family glycosyltransferase